MHLLPLLWALAIVAVIVYAFMRESRDRARNAPLRFDIEMRVCFSTALDHAMILGTGGFWIALKGPKRLVVGTEALWSYRRWARHMHSEDANRPLHSARHRPA